MQESIRAIWNFTKLEPMGRGIGEAILANSSIGTVDLFINGLRLVKNLSFKKRSLPFALPAGRCQIDVFSKGVWVATTELMAEIDKEYFIAITGSAEMVDVFTCQTGGAIPHGEAAARFVHLAPLFGKLDVSVHKGDVVFASVPYLGLTDSLPLTPFLVNLEARAAGTKKILISMPDALFERDTAYLVCFIGTEAVFLKEK
ncbi:DUF4397 domain-containing protein [Bacillus sp. FJAT-27245]|uniref:DUF4397 domain-containing protein n=1 Tax=Bacillus sp. FJAT-27245 TaxID=1684144 RepID=UPI0006A76259|nr:DUF4397 domain-containing protein [Bacillus sp. FJAT-27245]